MSVPAVVVQGIALGFEIYKFIAIEANVKALAARAGVSPEQLEVELQKKRAEFKASRDPNTLTEV